MPGARLLAGSQARQGRSSLHLAAARGRLSDFPSAFTTLRGLSLAGRRLALILGIAAFAALVLFFPGLVVLLTDWWWFREIGYQIVFTRALITRLLLFLGAGGITFGLLYLNLRIAQRGLVANPVLLQLAQSAPRLNVTVALRRLTLPLSLGLAFLAGVGATAAWDLVLRAIYGTQFGIADPVFSRDIGFYVFSPVSYTHLTLPTIYSV